MLHSVDPRTWDPGNEEPNPGEFHVNLMIKWVKFEVPQGPDSVIWTSSPLLSSNSHP